MKWACKLGISETVVHVVNRLVDYGSFSTYSMVDAVDGDDCTGGCDGDGDSESRPEMHERVLLKYMYRKDPARFEYVKAYFVHLMLDHLKETRHRDLRSAIDEFKSGKALLKIISREGAVVSFEEVVNEVASLFLANEHEIMADIHG